MTDDMEVYPLTFRGGRWWLPYGLVADAETLAAIRQARHKLDPAKLELHEARRFGRFIVHDLPEFTRLQHQLTELVSQAAGEADDFSRLIRTPLAAP